MEIVIKPTGVFIGIYDDAFDYGELGRPSIRRASHVEPDESGGWFADLSLINGPKLGPFNKRNEAIDAELGYLNLMLSESDYSSDQLVP
jgi:hypothetical protein